METFLPFLIFLARMTDVTMGTIRTISIYRGKKLLAFCLGFFEILIWVFAAGFVLKNLSHFMNVVAYALGFATGNFVGILLEERLVLGMLLIRIFSRREETELIQYLRSQHYAVTTVPARGTEGPVQILYVIIHRNDYNAIAKQIHELNPKAFYTVEDIKMAKEGVFPRPRSLLSQLLK